MTNEPSQLPWRLEGKCIYTAHGDFIGEMEHTDDARLVVDAVNAIDATKKLSIKLYDPIRRAEAERDRLRDIVKRMADKLEVHRGIFTASNVWSETGCHETCSLIREARTAIGEDAK